MENGETVIPECLLDGQVWKGTYRDLTAYVIPVANEQFWHIATISRSGFGRTTTRRAVSAECIPYYLIESGMRIAATLWGPTTDYTPAGPDGLNPVDAKPTSQPKQVQRYYVYFIRAHEANWVKIGNACQPKQRLKELQTGCPYTLILEAVILSTPQTSESVFHRRFAKYRHRGEWFRREGELAAFIDSLPRGVRRAKSRH